MFDFIIVIIILVILANALGPNRPILSSAVFALANSAISFLVNSQVDPGLLILAAFSFLTALLYFSLLINDSVGALDGTPRALFFRSLTLAAKVFIPLFVLFIILSLRAPVAMVLLAIALSACLVVFGLSRIYKVGNRFANKIYMGPHNQLGVQEQFTADLNKALRLKSEKNFPEALRIVNNLLIKDPNWARALLLKAQILDEAYGNKEAAKYIFTKIMQMKPDNIEATHSAATYLYEELCAGEIRKQ